MMDVAGGGKETGMTGDPAHGISVVVMNFTAKDLFAPRTILSRSNHLLNRLNAACPNLGQVDKGGGTEPDGLKDFIMAVAIQGRTTNFLYSFTQKHKAEIAVETLGARRAQRFFSMDLLKDVVFASSAGDKIYFAFSLCFDDFFEVGLPSWKTGAVSQEMAESHVCLAEDSEIGEKTRDVVIQSNFLLLD